MSHAPQEAEITSAFEPFQTYLGPMSRYDR